MDKITTTNEARQKRYEQVYAKGVHQTRLLRMLVILAVIYTFYLAKSLLIPLFFSAFIALLLSPLVSIARKFYVPRTISAAALMALLVAPFTFLGLELAEPAERWMQSLPKIAAEITEEIDEFSHHLDVKKPAAEAPVEEDKSFFDWFDDDEEKQQEPESKQDANSVTEKIKQSGIEMGLTLFGNAPLLLAQVLAA